MHNLKYFFLSLLHIYIFNKIFKKHLRYNVQYYK